jgi:hypothetical protein
MPESGRCAYIIDPSLKKDIGHHYRFSIELSSFFQRRGFTPELLVNRSYRGGLSGSARLVFKYGIYDDARHPLFRMREALARFVFDSKTRLKLSVRMLIGLCVSLMIPLEQRATQKGWHVVRWMLRLLRRGVRLSRRTIFPLLRYASMCVGVIIAAPLWLCARLLMFFRQAPSSTWRGRRRIGLDVALREQPLRDGDLFVFHTATLDMLLEFIQCAANFDHKVKALFIFHFDVKEYTQLEREDMRNFPDWIKQVPHVSFMFAGMTNVLCRRYEDILGHTVHWVAELSPPEIEYGRLPVGQISPELGDAAFAFLPGHLRSDKSLRTIDKIIETVAPVFRRHKMSLLVQVSASERPAFNKVLLLNKDWLRVLPDNLSDEAFYELIFRARFLFCPYEKASYRMKRSGAYTEASHFRKNIVFPRGTSMEADRYQDGRVFYWSHLSDLADACELAIAAPDESRAPDVRGFPRLFDLFLDMPYSTRERRLAVVFRADWARCGSNNTMLWQERVLSRAGYTVVCVFLSSHTAGYSMARRIAGVRRATGSIAVLAGGSTGWFNLALVGNLLKTLLRTGAVSPLEYWSCLHSSMRVPAHIDRVAKNAGDKSKALVLANHYFTVGMASSFARKHGLQRIYCDSHDLWSKTIEIASPAFFRVFRSSFEKRLAYEVGQYRMVKRVACVQDAEAVALRLQGVESIMIGVPGVFKVAKQKPFHGSMPSFLVLASDNPSNVDSYGWLFKNVIAQLPSTLRELINVYGPISSVMKERFGEAVKGVNFMGFIDDPATLYGPSTVVLTPVSSGTGVSVRVIEAITAGCVALVSDHGLRGLDVAGYPKKLICDTPAQWISGITHLATQPKLIKEYRALVSQLPLAKSKAKWVSHFRKFVEISN